MSLRRGGKGMEEEEGSIGEGEEEGMGFTSSTIMSFLVVFKGEKIAVTAKG